MFLLNASSEFRNMLTMILFHGIYRLSLILEYDVIDKYFFGFAEKEGRGPKPKKQKNK